MRMMTEGIQESSKKTFSFEEEISKDMNPFRSRTKVKNTKVEGFI